MKGIMTSVAFAALTLLVFHPGTAAAQPNSEVLTAPPSLAVWSKKVMTDLDRQLQIRNDRTVHGSRTGIVAVKFNCSESGAPATVELLHSSGNREYDHATVRAVRQIATLHPLPQGLKHDQKYVVRMLFADSEDSARDAMIRMRAEADRSNAWYRRGETTTAALELVPTG